MLQTLKQWDRELFIWLNGLGTEKFDNFWLFVTRIESWIPLFIIFFGLIIYYYKWKKGLIVVAFTLLTFGITLFLTEMTKDFVGRLRPNNNGHLTDLIRVLQKPTTFSFFSGHASSSFAITTFVFLSIRKFNKWIFLIWLWPLIFVLSRIYVGVHYPSDILVGALVGLLIALIFYKLNKLLLAKT